MLRPAFLACALIASAVCWARPMVIHESQVLEPPPGSGYYFFGHEVAIDGDWALVYAGSPSATPSDPEQIYDALLYRRLNGVWTLDRVLVRRVSTEYGQYLGFSSMAMSNGLAAIGSNPTHVFRRSGTTWTEIAHPFSSTVGDPNYITGRLVWDGTRLLAERSVCDYFNNRPWGALISRYNLTDGTWSPVERLNSGDTFCYQQPYHWGISGDTAVAGTYSNDWEEVPDQLRIFRRSGTTWVPTSAIDGGQGEGDVRGDEIFFSSSGPGGTLVYRNDDTQTVVDYIRTVSTSNQLPSGGHGFTHTSDVFLRDRDLFRKNAAGRYEHVATLIPRGAYTQAGDAKISGRRVISQAWRERTSANQAAVIFDLPTTYTPSPVIATGFGDGTSPFTPQLGTFAVATTSSGNRVYRQSSLTGEHRALLGNSDWIEQSIEADIRPREFSGTDRWVGLAVRYQDASNYYYVTLRSSGVVALRRMRNGAFTTLAQWPLDIVAGRNYHVSLKATGSSLQVHVDGKLFTWADDFEDPIPRGRAALVGYRTAVDYDNVVAAQVGARPIYNLPGGNCYGALENFPVWTTSGTGTWSCDSSTGVNTMRQTSTTGIGRALVGTPTDDQVVTSRARMTTTGTQDRWLGLAARYVDESNYYYLTMRSQNTVSLRKLVNGTITVLGTATYTVAPNTWYSLRLDAVGNELRAFVNGVQLLQATDSSHASGQGGILSYRTAAEFVDYRAWQP
jgi:hypothetical protein